MPRTKKILHRFGDGTVEEELTHETHWVQMVGTTIVRCDDSAKNDGWGLWTTAGPGRSSSWIGGSGLKEGINPASWIKDHHIETSVIEADYS